MIFKLEVLDSKKIIGCIVGFSGVVLINLTGSADISFNFFGDGFVFFSALAYAFSAVLIKIYGRTEDPVFGVILSALILNEGTAFIWQSVVALLLVCFGILIVNIERK